MIQRQNVFLSFGGFNLVWMSFHVHVLIDSGPWKLIRVAEFPNISCGLLLLSVQYLR